MVVRPTSASGFVCARRKLGHIRRNIQWRDVYLILRLGCLNHAETKGHYQQRDDRHVQQDRKRLTRAKLFVLRPDIFYLDGLDPRRQRRLFGRREEFLDARAEASETRSPGYRQSAIHRPFARRTGAEKLREVAS